MKAHFWKMHGIGNDYIYFDCFDWFPSDPSQIAKKLSDRHFSVGGDGVVLICRSEAADARMRMFNADGSEGKMCGNAIRCIGRFLYEIKGIRKETLTVETESGIKTLALHTEGGRVLSVRVDMGAPDLCAAHIPALFQSERVIRAPLEVDGVLFRVTCLSMGNPHCVTFLDPDAIDLARFGPAFEHHPVFPDGVNVEFVQPNGINRLTMRVWERGSGETWACGTGACAAAVAGCLEGCCRMDEDITVRLRGGELVIRVTKDTVYMTGPAEFAFEGDVIL